LIQNPLKLFLLGIQTLVRPIESSLTIEKSMHVKFEESNSLVKNVIEIDFLSDLEKILLQDSPPQEEDKPKDNTNGEVQDIEVEPT